MSWRPKEWSNYHDGHSLRFNNGMWHLYPTQDYEDVFEAGADAMLEALKGKADSKHFDSSGLVFPIALEGERKGTLVFIPDK